ncbi:MAG: hypothetical protein GWP66_09755 [Gammaproteobacteria bacterium]|jgi:hypothetical protein|nr:hypothetical protein [Gammaproteobacteria bacterium]
MEKSRRNPSPGRIGLVLAATLLAASGAVHAERCAITAADAHAIASENGFNFSCVVYHEESNSAAPTHFQVYDDGSIGCVGNTPNELGPAWIYLNFLNRDSGLGKGWEVWNYDVTGLPHTRIGAGAPIRLITGLLGPNARYEIKVSNIVLTNPYRKCTNFKDEAFK